MKKLFYTLLITLVTQAIFAAPAPQNISVKINFNYLKNATGNADKYQIENNVQFTTVNPKWTHIENKQKDPSKSNIILLSRVGGANSNDITFEFLVLDTSKNPAVIFEPKIIALYGQKNETVILDGNDILGITVLAKS